MCALLRAYRINSLRGAPLRRLPFTPARSIFGLPHLRAPSDFARAQAAALAACRPLVAALSRPPPPRTNDNAVAAARDVLHQLDALSDTICKVLDPAEAARNVCASRAWRDAATGAFQALAAFMYALNAHEPLYAALLRVKGDAWVMSRLSEEQRRMAVAMAREFERDGIGRPAEARAAIAAANTQLAQLGADFAAAQLAPAARVVLSAGECAALGVEGGEEAPRGLFSRAASPQAPREVDADPAFLGHVLRCAPDGGLRRRVLAAAHSDRAGGVAALEALRVRRAELAALVGFPSYGDLVASDRMAGSASNATCFLRRLAAAVLPHAAVECADMALAKAAVEGGRGVGNASGGARRSPTSHGHGGGDLGGSTSLPHSGVVTKAHADSLPAEVCEGAPRGFVADVRAGVFARSGAEVHAWDVPRYQSLLLASRLGSAAAEAAEYLPLSSALSGLELVMKRVFGVTMQRSVVEPGEGWVGDAGAAGGVQHACDSPSVAELGHGSDGAGSSALLLKFELHHDVDGALGTLYLDPFARQHKLPGAAHFVIRCGKRVHAYDAAFNAALEGRALGSTAANAMSSGVTARASLPLNGGPVSSVRTQYQLPIVVLVANFAAPQGGSSGGNGATPLDLTSDGSAHGSAYERLLDTCLSPLELETLFHEWGHAMHSLLSRTEFQHLSGTRGALDFVEVPSHVFEYWARDPTVVEAFARHHVTGAPMPRDVWRRYLASRDMWRATELLQTTAHALFDQALFGSRETVSEVLAGAAPGSGESRERLAAWAVAQGAQRGVLRAGVHGVGAPDSSAVEALHEVDPQGDSPLELSIPLPPLGADVVAPSRAAAAVPERGEELDSGALLMRVTDAYSCIPPTLGSTWHGTFGHAGTYGAGYYSYLYATAISAALWEHLFAADPFSRSAGERLRAELLAPGASRDPHAMLIAALGSGGGGNGGDTLTLAPLLRELKSRRP